MEESGVKDSAYPRLPIVAAVLVLLLGVGAIVALEGGGATESAAGPTPQRCMVLWNSDPEALAFGAHNFRGHGYRRAEVLQVDRAGVPSPNGAFCAVVFPAVALDPEAIAAAEVFVRGRWYPLSRTGWVSREHLARLQASAVRGSNATLNGDGSLDSL